MKKNVFAIFAAACAYMCFARTPVLVALDGNDCEVTTFPVQATAYDYDGIKRENLNRGVIAWRSDTNEVTVGWRYLSSDPRDISFDVYANGEQINDDPIDTVTYFKHEIELGETELVYSVAVHGVDIEEVSGEEGFTTDYGVSPFTVSAASPIGYVEITLADAPADNTTGDGATYSYSPGDAAVADVDGDGQFEILLKWNPSIQTSGMAGFAGEHIYECLDLTGKTLWRVNTGKNIRAGEHYGNFCFADFDGDGKAELVLKTADGTTDGEGTVIGDSAADWRDAYGRIMDGPEYITLFDGETGKALYTTNYLPERGALADMAPSVVRGWGDNWGNRMDRYLFTPAYLDGTNLSCVACRGIYRRSALTAWDWDGEKLTPRWLFDTTNTVISLDYQGQGFHSLRTGDIDLDGRDEIVYGAMAVDDDGSPLWTTALGHGDAMHLFQSDPRWPGLQVFTCHESGGHGCALTDARTGTIMWRRTAGSDTGRAVAGDIDGDNPGAEMWASNGLGMFDEDGNHLAASYSKLCFSMLNWWTGTLERSFLPGTGIYSYDIETDTSTQIASFDGVVTINASKSVPSLHGDLFGDWREEVMLPTEDGKALRIFLSPEPTEYRFWTFLEDPVYRHSLSNQHGCYNQPTQAGFYFGPDLKGHRIWFRGMYVE